MTFTRLFSKLLVKDLKTSLRLKYTINLNFEEVCYVLDISVDDYSMSYCINFVYVLAIIYIYIVYELMYCYSCCCLGSGCEPDIHSREWYHGPHSM